MSKDVVQSVVKGVMPTANGCAVFLGSPQKTFVITVDQYIGSAISMAINETKKERPLTHDLIMHIFTGLNVTLERVVINDVSESVFYARLVLKMENEVATKIVEIDARPSDCIALAIQAKRPIYVSRKVIDSVEDMTEVLERILKEQD
ncbi:MAG: bifunctional nuclease family protein [Verrucomicrobiota bacterium]|nr:bifunctional nuclease family protein [Verrucomicrobiota bacterium]